MVLVYWLLERGVMYRRNKTNYGITVTCKCKKKLDLETLANKADRLGCKELQCPYCGHNVGALQN
jgi:hypothetical protein